MARRFAPLLLLVAAAAALHPGCSCAGSASAPCRVDDDCRGQPCDPGQAGACVEGACLCKSDNPLGDVGRFASMQVRSGVAYVCAYDATWGDLVIGHQPPPGVVSDWEFVDGVPDVAPRYPLSQVRGGVNEPGDDVGRYGSLQLTPGGDPVMSYYDSTHRSLRFASFGAIRWHSHAVDLAGSGGAGGDDVGRYTAMTLDRNGLPGIAYHAVVAGGASGMPESELRFAQAKTANPQGAGDWTVTVIEHQPLPAVDPKAPPPLPPAIALFIAAARKPDDAPALAYYDGLRGNLVYVDFDAAARRWNPPEVLDGEDGQGNDTADAGLHPSIAFDADGAAHISYADATHRNLLYVNTRTRTPEVADDGYRPMDEQTRDGLPAPVYHLVGDSSSIQLHEGSVIVAYQDATVLQLRVAQRDQATGRWKSDTIAGHGSPFQGSYGFQAQGRVAGGQLVLSSYAINQHVDPTRYYVEVFSRPLTDLIQ